MRVASAAGAGAAGAGAVGAVGAVVAALGAVAVAACADGSAELCPSFDGQPSVGRPFAVQLSYAVGEACVEAAPSADPLALEHPYVEHSKDAKGGR